MASFIQFYLDTTAPDAQIITPAYTTPQAVTHIRVVSSEVMTMIYNLRLVDSNGVEHNYGDFPVDAKEFDKDFYLADFPLGKVTVYASAEDDVGNVKVMTPKSFTIYKANILNVAVSDSITVNIEVKDMLPNKIILSDEGSK